MPSLEPRHLALPASVRLLWRNRSPLTRTIIVVTLGLVSFVVLAGSLGAHRHVLNIPAIYNNGFHPLPPLYPKYAEEERLLPQHDKNLPFPEGAHGRFLRFEDQLWGTGLNNQLFEVLLNSEIAYRSNRAYVFTPFIWDAIAKGDYVAVKSDTHLPAALSTNVRATHVPLRAILRSPTSGEPWPNHPNPPPRSVSREWYDKVCPPSRRFIIDTTETNERIGVDFERDSTPVIIEKWSEYLRNLDEPCAHINWDTPRINDFRTMGSPSLELLWPSFSASPVMTAFQWSPVVIHAVENNLQLLRLSSSQSRIEGGIQPADAPRHPDIVPGLITLHVRRQDFEGRKYTTLSTFAPFHGWAQLSFLPDRLILPPSATESESERAKYVFPRCWLEIDGIVERLHSLRAEYNHVAHEEGKKIELKKVHVATNGNPEWVGELKKALWRDGWGSVTSTYDLRLDWEEGGAPVDGAIDMEMAARGEVFVGNGFSTFTSTTVSLRLVRGIPPSQTHFW
ncbi:hypothetical protein DL93DRAFT_2067058 [Clavulina sp. PMI_390]|nr:hypothetical protein DL93DRAFT_2067058 [Clavulina sp. PMI_390]